MHWIDNGLRSLKEVQSQIETALQLQIRYQHRYNFATSNWMFIFKFVVCTEFKVFTKTEIMLNWSFSKYSIV